MKVVSNQSSLLGATLKSRIRFILTVAAVMIVAFAMGSRTAMAARPIGIDVSHWQGTGINWASVKSTGVTFAYGKATQDTGYTDDTFTVNEANAKAAGVLIGAYHFARYDLDTGTAGAEAEAHHFWTVIKPYVKNGGFYMMPMLDSEYVVITNVTFNPGSFGYTKTTYSQWVNAFGNFIVASAASNGVVVKPLIYCGVSFASTWLNSTVTNNFTPWIANWNGQDPQAGAPSGTTPWTTWTFWQYSDAMATTGAGTVDGDVFQGTAAGLAPYIVGGLGAPSITSQPSDRWADRGGTLKMRVAATGTATLKYQWRLNGANITTATSSIYTLTNIQTTNGGSYTVVVTNSSGSVTSSVAKVTINPLFASVFSDNFDADSSANWTLKQSSADTRVIFAYNYSTVGIPSAPNSVGGTTSGLRMEANLTTGAVAALNVAPTGKKFSGDYRLHFDMWINANGPFPAGGVGSTEHLTAGVGTAGNTVQWNTGTSDGYWFANDGEGQASDTSATLPDIRAYVGTTLQTTNSGVYAGGTDGDIRGNVNSYYENVFPGGQTAPSAQQSAYAQQTGGLEQGSVGFAWRDVVVNKTNNTVEWFIDGLKICSIPSATFTASNVFVGYWDSFASVSDNTNLSFGLVDNLRVEVPVAAPGITGQPSGLTVAQGSPATFAVTATGSPAPGYQWRFNGATIANATSSSYTIASAQPGDAGSYSVVVTNAGGSTASLNAPLTVNVPPTISPAPAARTVNVGANTTFDAGASGTGPITYQWKRNGSDLAGQTTSSLLLTNIQLGQAGTYSVFASNSAGTNSAGAALSVMSMQIASATVTDTSNGFQFSVNGAPGVYELLASTDLVAWVSLGTFTNSNGTLQCVDLNATNFPTRYYRVGAPK